MTRPAAAPLRRVEHIMGLPISLDLRDPFPPLHQAIRQAFDWLREVDAQGPRIPTFPGHAHDRRRFGREEILHGRCAVVVVPERGQGDRKTETEGGAGGVPQPPPIWAPG